MTGQVTWDELKSILSVGEKIRGTISQHEPYGVFVNIGYGYRDADQGHHPYGIVPHLAVGPF